MGSRFDSLDKSVQEQLDKLIMGESLSPETERERFADLWLAREAVFKKHAEGLVPCGQLSEEMTQAFLVLTVSGSLVGLSPEQSGDRTMIYYSSGIRRKIPERLIGEKIRIEYPVRKGIPMEFKTGPVKKTSAVYQIARFPDVTGQGDKEIMESVKKRTLMMTKEWEELTHV